jgi:hypothetical protein
MAFSDLIAGANENAALRDIVDTINISAKEGDSALSEIDISLAKFLDELHDIHIAGKFRKILLWFFGVFATASFVLTLLALLCAIIVLLISLGLFSYSLPSIISSVLALGVGASFCSSLLFTIANRRLRLLPFTWGIPLVVASILLSLDWKWIAVGGILAFSTDHFRRRWMSLLPIKLSFGQEASPSKSFPSALRLFGGKLWPGDRKIFISYARRGWADPFVRQLRLQLDKMNVNCFLDIESIELGSSWRFALEEGIRRSSLFLFFDQAENDQPPRLWHRAELATASLLQSRTGFPAIAIVTPQEKVIEPVRLSLNRFSGLLVGENLRIIPLSPSQIESLARNIGTTPIRPHGVIGASDPISDLLVIIFFQGPVLFFLLALCQLANLCLFLAPLALLLFFVFLRMDSYGFLESKVLSSMIWLCIGVAFRGSLHFLFEAKPRYAKKYSTVCAINTSLLLPVALFTSLNSTVFYFVCYLALLLLGFVALDLSVCQGKKDFIFGMRKAVISDLG